MLPRRLAILVVAVVLLVALPFARESFGFPVFYLVFLTSVWFWAAEATSWNILSGYSGYFSFGQGAFVGVGAYSTAVLAGRHGWDYFATLPVAALLSTLLALAIGGLAFRLRSLRGEVFALLTLAVPFILASVARITPAIDGGQGIIVPVPDVPDAIGGFQEFVYLLGLAFAALAAGTALVMQGTRAGWALFAIQDAEDVAEGLGVPTFRNKMLAIGLTGLIGGLAGSVYALQIGFVTVEAVFGLGVPLFVIVMSVLGGRRHWLGPTLGALVIVTLQDRLSASGFEGWSMVVMGAVLATLIVLAPEGLVARLRQRPLLVGAAFAIPLALSAGLGLGSGLIDWLAAAMICAAVAAIVPLPRSIVRRVGLGAILREGPAVASAPAAPPSAAPSGASIGVVARRSPDAPSAPLDAVATTAPAAEAGDGPVVAVTDVTKRYGGVRALDGISLTIDEGELVGLVGPNGSGKSTLVGLISGSIRPTTGEIAIAGRSTVGLPPHRIAHLGVARTFQIPRPFGSMSVRDNVAIALMFGREPHGLEAARREADQYIELVGLLGRARSRPAEINLHERQLLEMARALATRPRILLLDEALAGLNPLEVEQAVGVVRRIHDSGVTIVIVEHLLRVVNQLATRVVVLEQGRTLAAGAPAVVMRDPAVVRAYLGTHADA